MFVKWLSPKLTSLPFTARRPKIATAISRAAGAPALPCLMPRQTEGFRWDSEADISLFALVWAKN